MSIFYTPILSLLLIFALSLLIIRIGRIAYQMTGLSPDVASFQALSAFSGTGYTTNESEMIAQNPQRRWITKRLIQLGNIGLVSAIASLTLSFVQTEADNLQNLLIMIVGIFIIFLITRSRLFNHCLNSLIRRLLIMMTTLDLNDYHQLLRLTENYRVAEIDITNKSWLANKTLGVAKLSSEGVLVLGIIKQNNKKNYIGVPHVDTKIIANDKLILYGKEYRLKEISTRKAEDDIAHKKAIEEYHNNN